MRDDAVGLPAGAAGAPHVAAGASPTATLDDGWAQNRVILMDEEQLPEPLMSTVLKMHKTSPVTRTDWAMTSAPVAGLPPLVVMPTSTAPLVRDRIPEINRQETTLSMGGDMRLGHR